MFGWGLVWVGVFVMGVGIGSFGWRVGLLWLGLMLFVFGFASIQRGDR